MFKSKKLKKFYKLVSGIHVLDVLSPYPIFYSFVMRREEKDLFNKYIKDSKYYLEFGSGGSTFNVLQRSKAIIHSVDNDIDWMNQISLHLYIRYYKKKKRLTFHHVYVGEIKGWGYPEKENLKHLFPKYSSEIFERIDKEKIDVIFIDGRFRAACGLKSILNCHSNENLVILIHDFWSRKKYHVVLKYLDELESVSDLGVFKIKKNVNLKSVKNDYEKYKYDLL